MKTFTIQIIILIASILGVLLFIINQDLSKNLFNQSSNQEDKLKINEKVINIEIADTQEKRSQGLGGRQSLASDSGMLFIFDNPDKHRFWMKGMKLPLDIVWINNNQVINVLSNLQPPSANQPDNELPQYEPTEPADKALEVAAGFIQQNKIKVGDKVEILR